MTARLGPVMVGALLLTAPVALADTISDDPDNVVMDALAEHGLSPCPRADLVEAEYVEPEDDWSGSVWLSTPDLTTGCTPVGLDTEHFRYDLVYEEANGISSEIRLELWWEGGEIVYSELMTIQGMGAGTATGVDHLVHEDNATLELPAPGEPPLEDVVVRSRVDAGWSTWNVESLVTADRIPNTGSATLG